MQRSIRSEIAQLTLSDLRREMHVTMHHASRLGSEACSFWQMKISRGMLLPYYDNKVMTRPGSEMQLQRKPRQGLVFSESKTASSRRCIALGREMLAKLRAHVKYQQQEKCSVGEKLREINLVFPSGFGIPMDPHRLIAIYKQLLKQAGLPDCRLHDLRHTAATLMLGWGIHPKVVQERLGHAHVSHTLGTYSHVLPSIQGEAAEKMDELVLRTGE